MAAPLAPDRVRREVPRGDVAPPGRGLAAPLGLDRLVLGRPPRAGHPSSPRVPGRRSRPSRPTHQPRSHERARPRPRPCAPARMAPARLRARPAHAPVSRCLSDAGLRAARGRRGGGAALRVALTGRPAADGHQALRPVRRPGHAVTADRSRSGGRSASALATSSPTRFSTTTRSSPTPSRTGTSGPRRSPTSSGAHPLLPRRVRDRAAAPADQRTSGSPPVRAGCPAPRRAAGHRESPSRGG